MHPPISQQSMAVSAAVNNSDPRPRRKSTETETPEASNVSDDNGRVSSSPVDHRHFLTSLKRRLIFSVDVSYRWRSTPTPTTTTTTTATIRRKRRSAADTDDEKSSSSWPLLLLFVFSFFCSSSCDAQKTATS